MIIKKFAGKTEEEALEAARKELGSGIETMNVKSAKKKGMAGLFGAKQVEVTVALEKEGDNLRSVRKEGSVPAAGGAGAANIVRRENAGLADDSSLTIEKKLDNLQNLLLKKLQQEEAVKEEQQQKSDGYTGDDKETAQTDEPENRNFLNRRNLSAFFIIPCWRMR